MAAKLARTAGLPDSGYRLVTNVGADGGQSVDHLHFHLIGGRAMRLAPGLSAVVTRLRLLARAGLALPLALAACTSP